MSDAARPNAVLQRAAELLGTRRRIAVLGVSRDREKYGYEVFEVLREQHQVFPINPKMDEVEGQRCYPSLDELPEPPEVIVLALGPTVTEQVVPACVGRGAVIWLPPGCFTPRAVELARAQQGEVLADICPVFVSRYLGTRQEARR